LRVDLFIEEDLRIVSGPSSITSLALTESSIQLDHSPRTSVSKL